RRVHAGVHGQGRPHRADELQQLQLDADRANAEGRIDHHAVRWVLGRRRRADDLRGGPGGAQRVFRGDRQAHSHVPAEESRRAAGVTTSDRGGWARPIAAVSRRSSTTMTITTSLKNLLALNRTVGIILVSVLFFGLGEQLWSPFLPAYLDAKLNGSAASSLSGVSLTALLAV